MSESTSLYIRFLFDVSTEEPAYVDVAFANAAQAQAALTSLTTATANLVSLQNVTGIPVLVNPSRIAAAFPIEYDEDAADFDEDDE
ncbi:MAG: hypothetical protein KC615_06950 [Anaerolineae bacterium]|nr:hypothetical protein [Anaerolineae bacterium]MCA9892704.1 hypothetical protein [Anaerolineae bacterium]